MSANKGIRALVGVAATFVVVVGVTVAVKWAYGAYEDETELVGTFPHAGQGLTPGSDVKYRGVNVGEVEHIDLVERQAEITFSVQPDFQVPEDASVTVRPKTLFGEMFLDLEFEEGGDGPWLEDGDELADAATATEVEELVAATDSLLGEIDATELAQVITSFTEVVDDQGDDIAAAWESGAELTGLFNDTIDAQTAALGSWAAFQEAIDETGASFNEISANSNLALPEFVRAREDFEHLLATLQPFADHLTDLLVESRPDIDTMFDAGDNVTRLLVAREENIREVVRGLAAYTAVFADISGSTEALPDGSKFAYFKNFIDFSDIEALLCREIQGAGDPGQPLLDALSALDTPLDCGESDVTLPNAGSSPPRVDAPDAQVAIDAIYGAVGQVDQASPATLQALVDSLLAGAAGDSGAAEEAAP
jgi:phospholipid/cholesterol/gamma-HCH transport system substrate-binding protein